MEDGNHDLLLECDNENITENLDILDNENVGGATVPEVGMTFNDEKEMFDFYKRYAYSVGFLVRKRNSKKGKDGVTKYVTFTCIQEGRRTGCSFKSQPISQTDCKARISASLDGRIWKINKVNINHNHKLSASVKRKFEVNDMTGIPLHKSYNSAVVEASGYENTTFVEKDCRNYVEQARRLRLEDALAMQVYFSKMQARCSGFYYNIDVDDECRLKNVFWADNRCRQSYKEFGDVVTFDTTYLTNKYDMPLASFVGVNHHGQSTLLGCGLLSNEDTETFVWLFRTWLECMHGQAPDGIITDQDRAVQNAIKIVFPNTKHGWCLWHIMKKLPEKFEYHVHKSLIVFAIHRLIYNLDDVQEFEKRWRLMLDKYKLHDIDWLSGLYENRHHWVPCFLKTTFWAGMLTTQCSESMNTFFDGYVNSKTSLKQFVKQYERALKNKVEKEIDANFLSDSQMVLCATSFEMEKQFQSVYTISKFKEVSQEFIGSLRCKIMSENRNDQYWWNYKVHEQAEPELVEPYEHEKEKAFYISFCRDKCELICSCNLFKFRGIICRHAITVLIRNHITSIPEEYILRRWRRDVNRAHTRIAVNYDGLLTTPEQLRYDNMCQVFSEVADLAANEEGWTHQIMELVKFQLKKLKKPNFRSAVHSQHNSSSENILDPMSSNRIPLESTSKRVKVAASSNKEERPRARHSNTEEGSINVQASQLPQCSMSSPLQNFVLPSPTNVVVNVEGDRAADLHNLTEQPLSPKDDRIVSANPSRDSAISRAPENTKDQPATSVTSGAPSTMHSTNAYNQQDQGIYNGGYDDGYGYWDEHSNCVNVNNLHVMPPAMSNDNLSLSYPTGYGFDSQMAHGQFSRFPSSLSPIMFNGQLSSPHQMSMSSPCYPPPVSPGLPYVPSPISVSQSEVVPSEISGQQNPMDSALFGPGSDVYVPFGAFGGGDVSGSSGVGLFKFLDDFGSSELLPNHSSLLDTDNISWF